MKKNVFRISKDGKPVALYEGAHYSLRSTTASFKKYCEQYPAKQGYVVHVEIWDGLNLCAQRRSKLPLKKVQHVTVKIKSDKLDEIMQGLQEAHEALKKVPLADSYAAKLDSSIKKLNSYRMQAFKEAKQQIENMLS